jgi:hypothetical protein
MAPILIRPRICESGRLDILIGNFHNHNLIHSPAGFNHLSDSMRRRAFCVPLRHHLLNYPALICAFTVTLPRFRQELTPAVSHASADF